MKRTTGGDGIKDDDLRRRQREAERKRDRRREASQCWGRPDSIPIRARIFAETQMELELAIRMVRDNVDRKSIIEVLVALRRSDPQACILESDVALAENIISLAEMRTGRMPPIYYDDDDDRIQAEDEDE